ncbi:MAG: c-type cytochrome domain-containing protein [Planctomycetaceae bacterium]|jgi:WD40 repeat protein|nr:c-type cytochrome domain-containing protein [Planctomycetaceae bacterium]
MRCSLVLAILWAACLAPCDVFGQSKPSADKKSTADEKPVSFYRQVRPVLQRHCSGCHFAAKQGGRLMLTSYAQFKKGGENGASFVPGKPDDSLLIDYIAGDEPAMPLEADPLTPRQVSLISRWIAQGAKDDTPATVQDNISAKNPPKYAAAPVITALAYSPDSKTLAISGYREIIIYAADGSAPVSRLVGRSQRIESLRFSPDGKLVGAVGGTPALFGEVQFWDPVAKKLVRSVTISYDTLFGARFSPDGKLFSYGGADNRLRVLKVADGKQVMRMDAHSDWVFGSTFSLKGTHVISVSRDRAMKLSIIASGQFVDNVTSITPGALKGGLLAVQRRPGLEQVLTGGSDGEPKLYKIFRTRKRIIGDDFNHIRSFQKMPGRIFDLQFSSDGKLFVAGSSTATGGAARIYRVGDFDTAKINNAGGLGDVRKQIAGRSAKPMLLHKFAGITSPIFAVAFRPDGQQVAIGGFDGNVRIFDAKTGKLVKSFVPVTVTPAVAAAK